MNDNKKASLSNMNTFIIKKLEQQNLLNDEIKKSFDDPNKYLSINPNLIIGKKPKYKLALLDL